MFPRSSTPPTGPRNSSPARRATNRGGVHKRRAGPIRIDKDGDLVMDAAQGAEVGFRDSRFSEGHRSSMGRASGRAGHSVGTSHGIFSSKQAQQALIREVEGQPARRFESRISPSLSTDQKSANTRDRRHDSDSSLVALRVLGLRQSKASSNPDGGIKDLLSFLERKANGLDLDNRRGVRIKKVCFYVGRTAFPRDGAATLDVQWYPDQIWDSWEEWHMEGDGVIIMASTDDLAKILKLNNFKFAGSTLSIESHQPQRPNLPTKEDENMSQEAKMTQDRIKSILSSRYDVNLKLLNLSRLGQDVGLVQMGMFDARNRISKLFPVLMVICDRLFSSAQEKREAVVSVTLAENELDSISGVTTLAQTFPDLQNLDLSSNKLSDLHALEGWRWKFRKLRNLKMSGNPIEVAAPNYSQEISKWYPTLQILNDVEIRSSSESATEEKVMIQPLHYDAASPIPINGSDFRDVNQIGEGFLRQFFTMYDHDRLALANMFYDSQSTHSISINISAPRPEHQSASHQFSPASFKSSRNLVKLKAIQGQMSRMRRGVEAIQSLWSELPPTSHPDLAIHTQKYLVDCHPISGLQDPKGENLRGVDGMILMVHGEVEENDGSKAGKVLRSFSRTFVLGPGSTFGPPIRVISDLLMLKAWSPLPSASVAPGASTTTTDLATSVSQRDILEQLVNRTQMTPEYATMCLSETGWDLEKAFAAFSANKSKLPADAFMATPIGL